MPKERELPNEPTRLTLMELQEEYAMQKNGVKAIGAFTYINKIRNKRETSRLFLVKRTRDGKEAFIIYDQKGQIIAWKKSGESELQVAKEIELNKRLLERQISLSEEKTKNSQSSESSSSDTSKAGDGRDKGQKEHEAKEIKKEKESEEKSPNSSEMPQLENLKGKIKYYDSMPKTRLNQMINGYKLWEILKLEEKLKGRLPEGMSESSFKDGYLTIMETDQTSDIWEKEYKLVVATADGNNIVELDEGILEHQYLGNKQERMEKENKRYRIADGEETKKPDKESSLTQMAKWKIKDLKGFGVQGEDWYLAIDMNKEYKENGKQPLNGKTMEISFVQEDNQKNRGVGAERTRESVEYKLEDITEPPLSSKEEKHMEQLRKKEMNEAHNIRDGHEQRLQEVVELLTEKYGEFYRKIIEQKVEQEHRQGKDEKDIERDVKENMEELAEEAYRHGKIRYY